GYAIAAAAIARGASVTLISGAATAAEPAGAEIIRVDTTAEMLDAARSRFSQCNVFIAAAAPADYSPSEASSQKRKKGGEAWTLTLNESPDILVSLSSLKSPKQVVVGFAAETEKLLENAAEKLKRKKLDLIVANDVTQEGAGFETNTNVVTFLWSDGRQESLPKLSKLQVAHRLLDAIAALLSN